MLRSIYYDPLPTPAGRSGRSGVTAGLIGWAILLVAALLYALSLQQDAQENPAMGTSLRVAAGWVAGFCVIAFFIGILFAAAGVTKQMNGVPDPGMKAVILGFALNMLPMLLVAAAAAYDKYGRKLVE